MADEPRSWHGTPHESPWVMVVPLIILALLSLVGGWIGVPAFARRLRSLRALPRSGIHHVRAAAILSADVSSEQAAANEARQHDERAPSWHSWESPSGSPLIGFLGAWYLYYKRTDLPAKMAASAGGLYRLVLDKYRIDEFYGAVIIQPLICAFDQRLLEGHRPAA